MIGREQEIRAEDYRFTPDPDTEGQWRVRWGVMEDDIRVGIIASAILNKCALLESVVGAARPIGTACWDSEIGEWTFTDGEVSVLKNAFEVFDTAQEQKRARE